MTSPEQPSAADSSDQPCAAESPTSQPPSDLIDFERTLAEVEAALDQLKQRYDQVRSAQQQRSGLQQQMNQLQQQLELLEVDLESRLITWRDKRELFWQFLRFAGIGFVTALLLNHLIR